MVEEAMLKEQKTYSKMTQFDEEVRQESRLKVS